MKSPKQTVNITKLLQAGATTPNSASQQPKGMPKPEQQVTSKIPAGMQGPLIRPLISKTSEQLDVIIAAGLSELPAIPTEQDYRRFNAHREAKSELMRRALNPATGSKISIAPKIR